MNELMLIDERNVLGKDFKMYGDINNPLFLARDVAEWIEYSQSSANKMLASVDSDEKLVGTILRSGQKRDMWFLTEDGLYEVLMQSRKPIAKAFKKQVKQILKQIRHTGGYIPVNSQDDDFLIMAKAHQILERTLQRKNQIILELQPKADTYDMIMLDEGTFDMNSVAKMVGMGEYKLFSYLRDKKVLFYNSNKCNVPFERFRYNGCFKVVDAMCPDGNARAVTRVTQKGIDYICKLIREDKEIA